MAMPTDMLLMASRISKVTVDLVVMWFLGFLGGLVFLGGKRLLFLDYDECGDKDFWY